MSYKTFNQVKKLLRAPGWTKIKQGLEILGESKDENLIRQVLDGTKYQRGGKRPQVGIRRRYNTPRDVIGRIVPGPLFPSKPGTLVRDELVCLLVIANSNHPLKKQITHLDITDVVSGYETEMVLDGLRGLSALTSLQINLHKVTKHHVDLQELSSMHSLRTLGIACEKQLQWLLHLPDLNQIETLDLDAMALLNSANNLLTLRSSKYVESKPLPKLNSLEITCFDDSAAAFCPSLKELRLSLIHI